MTFTLTARPPDRAPSLADEPCQVCGGPDRRVLFRKAGFDVVRCGRCGHVYVPFEGSRADLVSWYDEHFFSGGAYANYEGEKRALQRNFAGFVERLRSLSPGGRLFEVGAAYGFFLELARAHWEVAGIDIQADATSHARQRLALDVRCGEFLDLPLPESAFDVVVMWDTIEHLAYPGRYVDRVARMLKPGGIFAFTTGDVASLMARWRGRRWRLFYPPVHLHYFSRDTLRLLLDRAGLEMIEASHVGFHRSLDTMLYRVLVDRQPRALHPIYRAASVLGVTRLMLYLDLKDILFVVARKRQAA